MKIFKYGGKDITVLYDFGRCIHAEECVHGLGEVFNPAAKPWVHADRAPAAAIAEVIRRCPTGALHYEADDASLAEQADRSNTVVTDPGGPLYLRGRITMRRADGSELADTRVALCRCGVSKRKPLCDNGHRGIVFDDPGMARPGELAPMDDASEGLQVTPQADGPLWLQGPVTIRNASGEVIFQGKETWLCRCGASQNKPFCDGSHQRVGFQDS